MLLITKLMNANVTIAYQRLHSRNVMKNHKTSFRHTSHLTTSDLSKYYWELVDNGAAPTTSLTKGLNKRSEFISNFRHKNKR